MALTFVWPVMVAVLTAASVQYVVGDADCGGTFTATESADVIESPNYENGAYPNNAECVWALDTDDTDYGIKIDIDEMDIQGPQYSCEHDYIEVLTQDGAGVQRLCGKHNGHTILTWGSTAVIRFVSDTSGPAPGFSGKYQSYYSKTTITNRTESERFEDNGVIVGPNAENAFSNWRIYGPFGHGIKITFLEMNFPDNPAGDCTDGNMEVLEVHRRKGQGKENNPIARFCQITTQSPEIMIGDSYAEIALSDQDDIETPWEFTSSFRATYQFYQL